MIENLKRLCITFGVSSAEESIASIVKDFANQLGYTITKDRLGSVIATKQSLTKAAPTLMIACPMDEIGCMVSEVKSDGTLSFITLESIPAITLLNRRVEVLCQDNTLVQGIICGNSQLLDNQCNVTSVDQLSVHLFMDKEDILAKVNPGDLIGFSANYQQYEKTIISKALFPRCLNAVSLQLMQDLANESLPFNVAFAFVSQSVIGYRGTMTATYVTKPDVALALTCFDANIKAINNLNSVYVGMYDRQLIPSVALLDYVKANTDVTPIVSLMGNDGSFIHKTLQGTPTLSMGIALGSMGSDHEWLNINALDQLCVQLQKVIKSLDNATMDKLANGVRK